MVFAIVAGAVLSCDDSPTEAAPQRLSIALTSDSVYYGRTLRTDVRWTDSVTPLDPVGLTWSSSDTTVAVVDSTGLVLGTGPGTALITARFGNVHGTATVRVVMRRADGGVLFDRTGQSQLFSAACALTPAGQAYCLNRPAAGDTTALYTPIPKGESVSFTEVGTGFGSACGLATSGQLYCWGENSDWLLATRIPTRSDTAPIAVKSALRFKTIGVSGHTYVCGANAADDVVHCWGHGHSAVLGRQSDARVSPGQDSVVMPVRGNIRARLIDGGNETVCALDFDGSAYCWGNQSRRWAHTSPEITDFLTPARMAGGRVFTDLAVGDGFACGLEADGRAYCIGGNNEGQLGIGTTQPQRDAPIRVAGDLRFRKLHLVTDGPGENAGCGITPEGELYCWGAIHPVAIAERLGERRYTPVHIAPGIKFEALSAGVGGWCGLTTEGTIVCW